MIKILFCIFVLVLVIQFIKKNIMKIGYIDNRLNSNNFWMLSYDFKKSEKNRELMIIKSKNFRDKLVMIYYSLHVCLFIATCMLFTVLIDIILATGS
ncbi:hypothetical protein HIMB114_00011550 [alpha proteobacterium HIMB114]|uniref:hypothetical protein n=1 Tax=Candidatus Pelagibacter sp. HIMB109 TaxID=3415412 RepID=UPI0001BB49DC|nr:hypothetical protein HIMB114_00011550 [alpha proteobacterium HIMB114]